MHHRVTSIEVHELAAAEPIEQLVAIGCVENGIDRVFAMGLADTFSDREQIEIVIAENGDGALAQAADEAQRLERLRTAIDEIADEPERVVRGIELETVEQAPELIVAALDVAYCVSAQLLRLAEQVVDGRFDVGVGERHVAAFGGHRAFAFERGCV